MASSATVTAKAGPGLTVTAVALTGVTRMDFGIKGRSILEVYCDQGRLEYDINSTTTISCTITAGGNAAWTISQ